MKNHLVLLTLLVAINLSLTSGRSIPEDPGYDANNDEPFPDTAMNRNEERRESFVYEEERDPAQGRDPVMEDLEIEEDVNDLPIANQQDVKPVKELDVEPVEERDVDQFEERDVEQVEERNVDQFEERDVDQFEERDVDQVEERDVVDQFEERDVNQFENQNADQFEERDADQVEERDVDPSPDETYNEIVYGSDFNDDRAKRDFEDAMEAEGEQPATQITDDEAVDEAMNEEPADEEGMGIVARQENGSEEIVDDMTRNQIDADNGYYPNQASVDEFAVDDEGQLDQMQEIVRFLEEDEY